MQIVETQAPMLLIVSKAYQNQNRQVEKHFQHNTNDYAYEFPQRALRSFVSLRLES